MEICNIISVAMITILVALNRSTDIIGMCRVKSIFTYSKYSVLCSVMSISIRSNCSVLCSDMSFSIHSNCSVLSLEKSISNHSNCSVLCSAKCITRMKFLNVFCIAWSSKISIPSVVNEMHAFDSSSKMTYHCARTI